MFDNLSEKLQNIISNARGKELTQDNMQSEEPYLKLM